MDNSNYLWNRKTLLWGREFPTFRCGEDVKTAVQDLEFNDDVEFNDNDIFTLDDMDAYEDAEDWGVDELDFADDYADLGNLDEFSNDIEDSEWEE